MICERNVKRVCKRFTEIENYDKAISDTTQTWECHHRMENFGFSMNQLKKYGWYYNCDPEELIFLTKSEHFLLHQSGKRHYKTTHLSEETKKKLSERFKGKNNPFYGKCNEDTCKKVLCVDTGETYQSISEAANKLNLCRVGISSVCNGRRITCGGYHFRFIKAGVKNEQAI